MGLMIEERRSGWLATTVLLSCAACSTLAGAAERPNILLIMCDDMGWSDIGCYGGEVETPHLNQLAREGMRFSDAHASGPLCHMSRYGLLMGCYPFRTDVKSWRERPLSMQIK